jgi:hypothetical protein
MAGQVNWQDAGSEQNAHVVQKAIARGLYYAAAMNTLFGRLNGPRELVTQKVIHDGGTKIIDAGNDSPVWKKSNDENNRAVFTKREPNTGNMTYGDADVKAGDFADYMHNECNVRTVRTPAFPIVGFESADNFKRVVAVNQLVTVEKENISRFVSEEQDFDAFRALLMGASRGILTSQDGGMGISLVGANAGQMRVPTNTLVAGNDDLTGVRWGAADHNALLATAIANNLQSTSDSTRFTYDTHKAISYQVDQLGFKPVRVGGSQYRAVAIIDEWNIHNIRLDPILLQIWREATERSAQNKALYSRGEFVLDDILYIPAQQMRFFRPLLDASNNVVFGAGMGDPRPKSFRNNSNMLMTIVLGAGAVLRGTRSDTAMFTTDTGRHQIGLEVSYKYQDGWRRSDWYTADGRQEIANDSSLVVFNTGVSPMQIATA